MIRLVHSVACLRTDTTRVMRTETQGTRIVDAIVDRIPAVSQEATWTWWNKP